MKVDERNIFINNDKLRNLNDLLKEKILYDNICYKHNLTYEKYCSFCNKDICSKCEKEYHLNHNTVNYDIIQSMRSKRSSLDISDLKENFVNYNNKDNLSSIKCISNSLFSPKNKNIKYKPIIENENGHVIKRHLSHSRFVNKRPDIFEKIDEKTEIEESLEEIDYPKLIYNIKPRTKPYMFSILKQKK